MRARWRVPEHHPHKGITPTRTGAVKPDGSKKQRSGDSAWRRPRRAVSFFSFWLAEVQDKISLTCEAVTQHLQT